MSKNTISSFQEKIVGIEEVFSQLQSTERENAVGLLEDYLRKLKGQIKDPEAELQETPLDSCPDKSAVEDNNDDQHPENTSHVKSLDEHPASESTSSEERQVLEKIKPSEEAKLPSQTWKTKAHKPAVKEGESVVKEKKLQRHATKKGTQQRGKKGRNLKSKKPLENQIPAKVATLETKAADERQAKKEFDAPRVRNRRKIKFHAQNVARKKRLYVQKKKFRCNKCDKEFSHYKTMSVHMRTHGHSPMSCRFCKLELYNEVELAHHTCQRDLGHRYCCSECGDKFMKKKHLKNHLIKKHNLSAKAQQRHQCPYCPRLFARKLSLFMHYKSHFKSSHVCLKCGQICDDFNKHQDHINEHEKEGSCAFVCDKCGSRFERQQQYVQHLTGHKKYDCSDCNMRFTRHKELIRHRRILHGEDPQSEQKKFECEECHKKFLRPMQLEIHKRIHTGERPLECSVCCLSFRTTKALAKHRQTYNHCIRAGISTEEKKYLCSECGKAYFRKQALQRHIRYHTGDKPHTCQYCGYRCREQNNLKRHILLHFENQRNFICEVCGAAFHAKKTLEMHHKYKHTDIRDFACPECPMSFKAKNALIRHVKTHEKTKEHKCWCGAAFGRMYNLRRHMRMVHGDEESLPPVRKVEVLDADSAIKQAVKTPPAKKVLYKNKNVNIMTSEPEQIMMSVVHNPMTAEEAHSQAPIYNLAQQHPQLTTHLTDEQGTLYDSVTLPQSMVAYQHAVPQPPPIGAETVVDNQPHEQAPPTQADYYSNPSLLEAQANDYNNPYMYIQNVLLPSVAMAGLLDLSHAPPPPKQ